MESIASSPPALSSFEGGEGEKSLPLFCLASKTTSWLKHPGNLTGKTEKGTGMKSHEMIRQACDAVGSKEVATGMGVCHSLVNKWSEGRPDGRSVELNPLDRAVRLLVVTNDDRLLHWLCEQRGGYFTLHPPPRPLRPGDLTGAVGAVQQRQGRLEIGLGIILQGGELTPQQIAQLQRDLAEFSGDYHHLLKDYAAKHFAAPPPAIKPSVKSPVQPPPKSARIRPKLPLLLSPLLLQTATDWAEAMMAFSA